MTLAWISSASGRASLAGWVTDAVTHRPLQGALVRAAFLAAGGRPSEASATTAADGTFRFVGLTGAGCQVVCRLPGAGLRYGVVGPLQVALTATETTLLEIALEPTGIHGNIVSPVEGPVYPRVRLTGSSEEVYGTAEGEIWLLGIEPGDRTLQITAPGCAPKTTSVLVTRGRVAKIPDPIQLVPSEHHPFPPSEPAGIEEPTE